MILTGIGGEMILQVKCDSGNTYKINKAKTKYLDKEEQTQLTGALPDEMQEEYGQDSRHKVHFLHVLALQTACRVVRK